MEHTDIMLMPPCSEQANHDKQEICDIDCESTYTDSTTLEETCDATNVSASKYVMLSTICME